MFRTSLLARAVARRQPTAVLARQQAAYASLGGKQPSTATTQSADSANKTPSRPQSETVRTSSWPQLTCCVLADALDRRSRPVSPSQADAQPSGMDSMPGSGGADNSFSNADGSQHALKEGAESSEARETYVHPALLISWQGVPPCPSPLPGPARGPRSLDLGPVSACFRSTRRVRNHASCHPLASFDAPLADRPLVWRSPLQC
jgi:hypothetical protein